MGLSNCILGTFLKLCSNKNIDLAFSIDNVRGVNNKKQMMSTKADLTDRDLSKFQIVYPGDFVFNHRTSRNGSKFSIAYNDGEQPVICTEDYVVFRIRDDCKNILNPKWLYMFFNRPEFDRFVITNSWGSSTEFYNWEDIQAIQLSLPDMKIQNKFVDVYNAMVSNQKAYERGLEDLKLTCDAYIEDLRRKMPCEKIEKYIIRKNDRNIDRSINFVMGLSTKKEFREAQSRVNKNDLGKYKVVNSNDFVFVPTTDTWKVLAFALNTYKKDVVVSPIYEVFKVNKEKLIPQYLAMWLSRTEFDRYARFHSWGSARENFSFEDMQNVRIPIPPLPIQQSIVDIYTAYKQRRAINERLKAQIKTICPILIKGSIEEGRNTKEIIYGKVKGI